MRRRRWQLLIHAFLIGFGIPALGEAISNTETFGGFEFNFNNPGARALGMGGAFLAVADDATTVVTNPAGLPILQRPEISAEVKFTEFTNTIRAYANTPQEGRAGVYHSRDFDNRVTTPSFFSFVYPTERLVGAVFVREQMNFESSFTMNGVFQPDGTRNLPVKSSLDITTLNFGGGVGLNLAKVHPLLPNIGASIEFSDGSVDSLLQRFGVGVSGSGVGEFSGPPNFSPQNVFAQTSVSGSDIGVGFNVGALWRPIENLAVGAVFRGGPRFNMQQTLESGPALCGTLTAPVICAPRSIFDFTLKVPDVWGAGMSYRLFDRLTIALDVVRIRYSQLLENFQIIFNSLGQPPSQPSDYKLDDATEVHVGAEYVFFVRRIPFAIRAGFFTDPDHKIRFTGPTADVFERSVFQGGKDQTHFTVGFGLVPLHGFQIDFATNQSDTVKEYVISTVYRF
jgi:long-chain fatty acid transport protein